jgi:hypothetical protein
VRQHGDSERREPEATGSVQELLRAAGFESHLELRDLLLCVPLETADQREEFERWLECDGTKAGLLRRLTNPVWLRKPSGTR